MKESMFIRDRYSIEWKEGGRYACLLPPQIVPKDFSRKNSDSLEI